MTMEENILYIGKSNFRGSKKVFGIKNKDRFQHMYVIGQTGTGKTSLLRNLALQDIEAGRGIAVVDPHGEFARDLLAAIPQNRLDDVVYFNPIDTDFPIGFNILEVKNPDHKHLVSSGLMSIFTKIWANVWSARMEYILNNTVLALLDTPGTTLLGIPRMLVDKVYRQRIIDNCKDPVVRSYWINEYEQYQERFRTEAIAPIQNKVGQFLATHLVRNIVGQPKSTLNIEQIMNEGKILLVNVSKGLIGEDNSALLGAMLITKIQLAAMERVRIKMEERRDFILFIDEFQNFVTDSFASILSEARKYRLGMVISHQYIGQLVTEQTQERLKDAVFGNVGTTITFRVSAQDAEFLEKHYAPYLLADDLIGLPNHHVYMKMMIDGLSSRPFSATTLPPIKIETTHEQKLAIINNSRRNYGRPRAEVEDDIAVWASSKTGEMRHAPDVAKGSGMTPKLPNEPVKPKYKLDLKALGIEVEESIATSPAPSPASKLQPITSPATPQQSTAGVTPPQAPSWYNVDPVPKQASKWPPKKKPQSQPLPQTHPQSQASNQPQTQPRPHQTAQPRPDFRPRPKVPPNAPS